ncbi:hypothetical protein KGF56_000888 [Candida oxycetoniae]|uniref:Abscisic acid G-protein coupled receptor-like domain-containing protein n=1 Tax=Candida oxycetoniae TaxID=497107 RepID=A0AAI9T0Z4_9ASCO|nr:uncharacterized protein KGF56_000888 [Candida oxycetoniae]KAI3406407.2 hypothetical protein KGF56_000888 [Candida oxycetoniae]
MSFSSILLYIFILVLATIWIYSFVYNRNLLQRYSTSLNVPISQINEYIDINLSKPYQLQLIEVNVLDDEAEAGGGAGGGGGGGGSRRLAREINKSRIGSDLERSRDLVTGVLFSTTVSFSVGLIILMMCELGDYFTVNTRASLFKLTIDILMILLALILPFCSISLLINNDVLPVKSNSVRVFATFCVYAAWFLVLHKCGDLTQDFYPRSNNSTTNTRNLIERKINEVSIVGITILAVLSGVGSISTPQRVFSYKGLLSKLRPGALQTILTTLTSTRATTTTNSSPEIGVHDINSTIQNFNNTTILISKRKRELEKLQSASGGTIYNLPNSASSTENVLIDKSSTKKKLGSLIHKVQSFANLPMHGYSEEQELEKEIKSLYSLKKSLYSDVLITVNKFTKQAHKNMHKKLLLDNLMYWGNIVLAFYCIYRIFNVFFVKLPLSYIYGPPIYDDGVHSEVIDSKQEAPSSKDALAISISKIILTIFGNIPISELQLVNQLSFILSGSLFCCSFTNVLTTLKSFSQLLPLNMNESQVAKTWLKYLLVAELLGVYVLATALLIRTNLPENLSNQISKMLSLSGSSSTNARSSIKEVMFIDTWFDKVFAISCLFTGIFIGIRRFTKEDDALGPSGSSEFYDEESLLEGDNYKQA